MSKLNVEQIENDARKWYTAGRYFLPQLGGYAFANAIRTSVPFVRNIIGDAAKEYSIEVTNQTLTGFIRMDEKKIYISSAYFNEEFINLLVGESEYPEAIAVTLINRTMTHEALHAKHTKVTPGEVIEQYGVPEKWERYFNAVGVEKASSVWQLVEDLFIENDFRSINKAKQFVLNGQQILFRFDDEHTYTDETLEGLIELLTLAKNRENRNDSRMPYQVRFWIDEARAAKTRLGRVRLAEKILDRYIPEVEEEPEPEMEEPEEGESEETEENEEQQEESEQPQDDQDEPSESESEDTDESESEETEDDTEDSSETENGETEDGETEDGGEAEGAEEDEREYAPESEAVPAELKELGELIEMMSDEEVEHINQMIAEILEEENKEIDEEQKVVDKYGEEISWERLVEFDVMDIPNHDYPQRIELGFDASFVRDLIALRSERRIVGAPRNEGAKLVGSRLHRITTDSKVYANLDSTINNENHLEIIINVDASGSTNGEVYARELGAAKEISKALRQARVPHMVVAHSSLDYTTPMIVRIFSFQMGSTDTNFEERFEMARKIDLNQNFDGVVIERIREYFSSKRGAKYIINLSDGKPAGGGYYGWLANKHTREVIQETRDASVGVFSLSVVGSVVKDNNNIYGKEFNIDASKNTAQQFRALVQKLAAN